MTNITVDVIFDDATRHLMREFASEEELERHVMQPNLMQLAFKMKVSGRQELGPPIKYHGDMQRGLLSKKQGVSEVVIMQMAPHGEMVRFGTEGPYEGFPVPVKTWAEQKLGLSPEDAGAVARKVQMEGTSRFFEDYYPEGARGFNYPEYLVKEKERDSIDRAAEKMGEHAVAYALGKAMGSI